jgi:hypothetical protein
MAGCHRHWPVDMLRHLARAPWFRQEHADHIPDRAWSRNQDQNSVPGRANCSTRPQLLTGEIQYLFRRLNSTWPPLIRSGANRRTQGRRAIAPAPQQDRPSGRGGSHCSAC